MENKIKFFINNEKMILCHSIALETIEGSLEIFENHQDIMGSGKLLFISLKKDNNIKKEEKFLEKRIIFKFSNNQFKSFTI